MELRQKFEAAHTEHAEILEFLNIWEKALDLIANEDCDARCMGLRQLQRLEERIAGVCEHCRKEEEDPESLLSRFTPKAEQQRLKEEHAMLERANFEFRREMEFTTSSHTEELALQGQGLLAALRGHIAYEEELLRRFEENHLHPPEAALRA